MTGHDAGGPQQRRVATGGRRQRDLVPLAAITFRLWLGSSILVPALPLLGKALGLPSTAAAFVVAARS